MVSERDIKQNADADTQRKRTQPFGMMCLTLVKLDFPHKKQDFFFAWGKESFEKLPFSLFRVQGAVFS